MACPAPRRAGACSEAASADAAAATAGIPTVQMKDPGSRIKDQGLIEIGGGCLSVCRTTQ